jgi:hypothetical protein
MPKLPNIVRERLKVSRPMAAHPDADVLTAFAERALPESERAVVAEHLARCHDCRDLLVLALPAAVAVETACVPLPARSGWFRAPVLRWGVVAAGVAVFAAAGLMQYGRGRAQRSSVAQIQRYDTLAAPDAKTATTGRTEEPAKVKPGAPSTLAEPANAVPASVSRLDAGSTIARNTDTRFKKEQMEGNETARLSSSGASNLVGSGGGLPLHGSAASRAPGVLIVEGPLNQTPSYRKTSPSPTGVAGAQSQIVAANTPDRAMSRAFMDVTVDKAKAPAATVEVSAEAPVLETAAAAPAAPSVPLTPRWAISSTGGLLRSFDQGSTWTSVDVNASFLGGNRMAMVAPQGQRYQQSAPDTAQLQTQGQVESKTVSRDQAVSQQKAKAASVSAPVFRAVSAAGLEIWAGGSAGVLYHSADGGERWTRVVPSAYGILVTGDIVGIAFSDSQHGQVSTSTQELWTTSDAGLTWQKQ